MGNCDLAGAIHRNNGGSKGEVCVKGINGLINHKPRSEKHILNDIGTRCHIACVGDCLGNRIDAGNVRSRRVRSTDG